MWKPFLARSVRSVFGGRRHAVPPCGADRIFFRAYTGWEPEAGGGREVTSPSNQQLPRPRAQRRHLYVVLRACKGSGYRFHKINLDDALEDMNRGVSEGNGMDGAQNLRRLPEAILRIGSRRIGAHARIHALGSNLVITGAANDHHNGLTLVYDTDAAELDIAEDLPDEMNRWHYKAVAAGDKLHALQVPYYLWEAPPPADSMRGKERWTWVCSGRSPIPTSDGASYAMRAHAVHPDGRTVFVSIEYIGRQEGHDTFSLDTESGEWTHRGNWRLPFNGQGHYDGDLEAWVGIVYDYDGETQVEYLCSCDVPDLAHGSAPPPAWKLGGEKLTLLEAPLTAIHAPVLLHTGHGRFCLVESASLVEAGATPRRPCSVCDGTADVSTGHTCTRILRATMFRPKYGKNGELVVATAPRPTRSYEIPSDTSSFYGPAFWI